MGLSAENISIITKLSENAGQNISSTMKNFDAADGKIDGKVNGVQLFKDVKLQNSYDSFIKSENGNDEQAKLNAQKEFEKNASMLVQTAKNNATQTIDQDQFFDLLKPLDNNDGKTDGIFNISLDFLSKLTNNANKWIDDYISSNKKADSPDDNEEVDTQKAEKKEENNQTVVEKEQKEQEDKAYEDRIMDLTNQDTGVTTTSTSKTGNSAPVAGTGEITNIDIENIDVQKVLSKVSELDKKKISQLTPEMQKKVIQLYAICQEKGLNFTISSGLRTREEQEYLANKYKNIPGRAAKPGTSKHEFGKAIDISATKGTNDQVGLIAESIGMTWGGRFTTCREDWHIQIS